MKKIILTTLLLAISFLGQEVQAFLGSIPLGTSCGEGGGVCVTNSDFQKFNLSQAYGGANCTGFSNFCATNYSINANCDYGSCGLPDAAADDIYASDYGNNASNNIDYGTEAGTEGATAQSRSSSNNSPNTSPSTSSSSSTKLKLIDTNYDELLNKNLLAKELTGGDSIATGRTMFQGTFVKFANMILGTFAIIWVCFLGIQFVVSRGNEEKMTELKKQAGWIALGLVIIAVAEFAAFKIFDPTTLKLLDSTGAVDNFDTKIMQIKTYFEYFVASVMLISLLISGYNLIAGFDNDEKITEEKKIVTSFLIGTGLILLAEVIVKLVAKQAPTDSSAAITTGIQEIAGIINFVSTFLGVVAVFMLIVSSIYYIVSLGNDDQTSRAKNIIIGSITGIVIAVSSYAISTFLIL
jgi:hypothetical protein